MKPKYIVPNLFTASSLVLALVAIGVTQKGNLIFAAWLIVLSMLCDGLDGKVARLLHASSEFGAEFDSLADFVAFGVTPAFLIYNYSLHEFGAIGAAVSISFVVSGALRLARFNIKNDDLDCKQPFEGLPIPSGAGLLIAYIFFDNRLGIYIPHSEVTGLLITMLSAFLMISKIEYLPIEKAQKKTLWTRLFTFICIIAIILAIKFSHIVFFLGMSIYVLWGIIRHVHNVIQQRLLQKIE